MASKRCKFHSVRKVTINKAMLDKNHEKTLMLCKDGIKEAERAKHPGTVSELRKTMLTVYLLQNDKPNILATAELLFLEPHADLTFYRVLHEQMDGKQWIVKSAQHQVCTTRLLLIRIIEFLNGISC
jgi:hypothetical protein